MDELDLNNDSMLALPNSDSFCPEANLYLNSWHEKSHNQQKVYLTRHGPLIWARLTVNRPLLLFILDA